MGYEFNAPTVILGSTSVLRTSKRQVAVVWRPAWVSNTKYDFEIHGRSWQLPCKVATCSCWRRRFPCFAFCKTCHAQGKEAQKEQESSSSTRGPCQNEFEHGPKVRQTFVARSTKADSTLRSSQAVPHPSSDRALRRLTSEVERDPAHSTWYGRQRKLIHEKVAACARLPGLGWAGLGRAGPGWALWPPPILGHPLLSAASS